VVTAASPAGVSEYTTSSNGENDVGYLDADLH
jgi:hypothetical protein